MRRQNAGRLLGLIVLLAGGLVAPVQGQAIGRVGSVNAQGTAYKVFAEPAEATVQVLVLGGVSSGIYEIGVGTDLGELFALTGGAQWYDTRQVRRQSTARLYRSHEQQRSLVYEASIEDMLQNTGEYPVLRDGDLFVVEVDERPRFDWRDGLRLFTAVNTVLLLASRLGLIDFRR